jgi:hypothetical protein
VDGMFERGRVHGRVLRGLWGSVARVRGGGKDTRRTTIDATLGYERNTPVCRRS